MKPDGESEPSFQETLRAIEDMDIAASKGLLWKLVAHKLIIQHGVSDANVFYDVANSVKELGLTEPTIQDAISEFISEGRDLLK